MNYDDYDDEYDTEITKAGSGRNYQKRQRNKNSRATEIYRPRDPRPKDGYHRIRLNPRELDYFIDDYRED